MGVKKRLNSNYLTNLARNLRRNCTDAEKLLWQRLRNRQVGGVKFRRQQPIGQYIVDFMSFEKKLVIELDGGQHNEVSLIKLDRQRDRYLRERGYTVLRFWDNEVLRNTDGVLEVIAKNLGLYPHPNPLPKEEGKGLSSPKGRGLSPPDGRGLITN